jgi:hypothetical protein
MTLSRNEQYTASLPLPRASIIHGLPAPRGFALTTRTVNRMEKEFVDRAKAIRQGILQLRDSL